MSAESDTKISPLENAAVFYLTTICANEYTKIESSGFFYIVLELKHLD